jgi:hypothetical protein
VRPRCHSMTGRVNDGDHVTVAPLGDGGPTVDDIVLVHYRGRAYLHLVKARQVVAISFSPRSPRNAAEKRPVGGG